jgi:hypothetical protein
MKKSTIEFALCVLDSQFKNMLLGKTEAHKAYYEGMKLMFNVLISEGYETKAHAKYYENGCHYVVEE